MAKFETVPIGELKHRLPAKLLPLVEEYRRSIEVVWKGVHRARSRLGRALSRRRTSASMCPRARFLGSRVGRSRASPTTLTW
jgi:hypothetical protein